MTMSRGGKQHLSSCDASLFATVSTGARLPVIFVLDSIRVIYPPASAASARKSEFIYGPSRFALWFPAVRRRESGRREREGVFLEKKCANDDEVVWNDTMVHKRKLRRIVQMGIN